jgi:hypothetical protein
MLYKYHALCGVLFVLCQLGCTTHVPTEPCTTDVAPEDATVSQGFRLTVLTPHVVLAADESTTLLVRIDRAPGFDTPVLVQPAGLPDGVFCQPRENRPEDVDGVVVLILVTSEEGPGEYRVPNFVVQGTDGEGLQHTDRVTFE